MIRDFFLGLGTFVLMAPLPAAIILNILGYHSGQEGYSLILIIMEIVGVILLFLWDNAESKAKNTEVATPENKMRKDRAVSTSSPEGN